MIQVVSSWMKNIPYSKPVKMWIDVKELPTDHSTFNIFYACEPYVINRHERILEWIIENHKSFDLILSHDERILQCPNAVKFCWTSTLINPLEEFDYNKKFQVSFICGGKLMCGGHWVRRWVWERQDLIKIPKRLFYSTQVTGGLPIYPGNEALSRDSKYEAFKDSMFHIAMENSDILNYFSEKLIDCFLSKTVPIYFGCPNIDDFFDVRGIIIVKSIQELFNVVNSLSENDYHSRKEYMEKNYQLALKYPIDQVKGMGDMLIPILDLKIPSKAAVNIYYGVEGQYKDVTLDALHKCPKKDNTLVIPAGEEERARLFGDPVYGKVKHILVEYPKYKLIHPHYQTAPIALSQIDLKFAYECSRYSDIYEHLPILEGLARSCGSIIELGVRKCVSSWAFAHGLMYSKSLNKKMLLNDIIPCDVELLKSECSKYGIEVDFVACNDLELEVSGMYDMTFIDTWHVYGQLKRELAKFSKLTRKYIVLHDTTIDAEQGETVREGWDAVKQSNDTGIPVDEICKGLWPAVEEFLASTKEWVLDQRLTNNNGLTILKHE